MPLTLSLPLSVRHPVAVIPSAVELLSKVLLVQGVKTQGAAASQEEQEEQFAEAERTWAGHNRNILDAFEHDRISISYEQLVVAPEKTLQSLCRAIGVSFCDAMLDPYDALNKMDDNSFARASSSNSKIVVGDDKIFKRATIEAAQADKWRSITLPAGLAASSRLIAGVLGYSELPMYLPRELVRASGYGIELVA